MSQTELATQLGVTFQQVQKYEKGVNRVGAARLQRIAAALDVPISFFFSAPDGSSPAHESIMPFLETAYAVRLVRAFSHISDREVQRSVVDLIERIADSDQVASAFARRGDIPLGGSSNHFQTAVLRAAGAWDPFNVTEDADLGTRLARLGYRTATIASTTYEEAPASVKPWLKQRTRWFKGWMQTYLVHMRDPCRLARDLGVAGFTTFHLMLAGTVLAALVQPILIVVLLAVLVADVPLLRANDGFASQALIWTHGAALAGGYAASGVLGFIGLKRRRLLSTAWALMLLPLYWPLLSVAAWRAVAHLAFDPYGWEKTEHGLARTSRRLGSG